MSRACHLGRKPRKGGKPARERKAVERISFWAREMGMRAAIFREERLDEERVSMVAAVERA